MPFLKFSTAQTLVLQVCSPVSPWPAFEELLNKMTEVNTRPLRGSADSYVTSDANPFRLKGKATASLRPTVFRSGGAGEVVFPVYLLSKPKEKNLINSMPVSNTLKMHSFLVQGRFCVPMLNILCIY